jgi:HAD superfamily hydrolase (TIGR01509 family)
MVDNIPLHMEAFNAFLARRRLPPLTEETRAAIDGKRNRDVFPIALGRPMTDEEALACADEKEQIYRDLSRGRLVPRPGLVKLLGMARTRDIPVAIATSAPVENVRHTLAEIGLTDVFPHIARGDDVPRGKPHPDVFLLAARLIDVPPGACVAFEDAPSGIVAAVAAGMTTVALGSSHSPAMLELHGARPHHVAADFTEYLSGPGSWL